MPTNRSLEAQANSSSLVRSPGLGPPGAGQPPIARPLSFSSSLQDSDVVRHHVILGEALSTEALGKGGHRNSLLGPAHWLVFYNHSGQVGTGQGVGKGDPDPSTLLLNTPFLWSSPTWAPPACGPRTAHPGRPPLVHGVTPDLGHLPGLQPLR